MTEPQGLRHEIVTFLIREKTGLIIPRGSGLKTVEAAEERAAEWVREKDERCTIERKTYTAFTHVEPVRTLYPPEPPPPVA